MSKKTATATAGAGKEKGEGKNLKNLEDALYKTPEEKFKIIGTFAKSVGMESFVMGYISERKDNKANVSTHFQNIQLNDTVQIQISGLHQAITMHIAQHPEFSDAYRQIFQDMLRDLNAVVNNANAKVTQFQQKAGDKPVSSGDKK
mgnify:CR=1 FL=1